MCEAQIQELVAETEGDKATLDSQSALLEAEYQKKVFTLESQLQEREVEMTRKDQKLLVEKGGERPFLVKGKFFWLKNKLSFLA